MENKENEETMGLSEQKKRLLHWSVFIGLTILALVLGDAAMPSLPPVIQASVLLCLIVMSLLYLYTITIETEFELHLGLLAIITVAYALFTLARLAIGTFSPPVIGASAIAIIVALLGYVWYPKVKPMVAVVVKEPKAMKRVVLPQFRVKGDEK